MPTIAKTPPRAIAVSVGLGVLALLLWVLQLATLADLGSSDPAGNALAEAYASVEILVLWALLFVMATMAAVRGAVPKQAALAALILVPASGFAAMTALRLLADPDVSPHHWPIIVPALVPPLVLAFCCWASIPSIRAAVPAGLAAGIVWGGTLVLSTSVAPLVHMRSTATDLQAAARARYDADLSSLPSDAPLWAWTPFLATRDDTKAAAVLARIRRLDRRQSDAEIMLDRGDFPLSHLGSFDLDPTPSLCGKARALLRTRVVPLAPRSGNSRPYTEIAEEVAGAVAAMDWLVDYDCSCDAESQAWESTANAYRDPNYDVVRLAELRDRKRLGRALRDDPARFSMLTPSAHLRAWLKFADQKDLREEALAGARRLDHRTADAVEMLGESDHAARTLLRYLPLLDLEGTAPLCQSALRALHGQLETIYRPGDGDPRPYEELLDRLGNGEQFSALKWLVDQGCEAEVVLGEAEDLVRAYQDSPDRAAMLATLTRLHRKPE
jgi:hypothetical protein